MTGNNRPVGHLLRVLGLAFGVAVVVGGTIGQGIGAAAVLGIGYALFDKSEREETRRATAG